MASKHTAKPSIPGDPTKTGPEIVFGLVAPVGVDLDEVCRILEEALSDVGYDSEQIRLSQLLHNIPQYAALAKSQHEDKRIHEHMNAGNDFRRRTGRNDALALLGVAALRERRVQLTGNIHRPCERKAFILRSLKHPEEVRTLRRIYGMRFHLISASSTRDVIVKTLARRIADSHSSLQSTKYLDKAESLITRDESESSKYGQQVRGTFHSADLFVRVNETAELKQAINRYVEAVFGYPFHTPTRDEYGMFHAHAAALRSASLGRQVGAAIATSAGDIVAVGTNEVPKAGGGLYWEDDAPDKRDHVLGYDSSDSLKRRALADLLSKLKERGWLSRKKSTLDVQALVDAALSDARIKGAQMMDSIEFMRAVHAEMASIVNAATRGVSVERCTLYTTTFPCHDCAKHVVAAGITRVAYIEPYPKSLAVELYPDSVQVESTEEAQPHHVPFEPFVGIAPRKYIELFTMLERKDGAGLVIKWNRATAIPRALNYSLSFYTSRESSQLELMRDAMAYK